METVARYQDFLVFAYGGYERAFLKRMRKRAKQKAPVDRVLKALVNTLSLIYSHVYFPTYSNGLKDVGATWAAPGPSQTPRVSRASSGGGVGRRRQPRSGSRSSSPTTWRTVWL